jgi:hypothetical protein
LASLTAREELDEPSNEIRHLRDPTCSSRGEDVIRLLRLEVTRVLVDLDACGQSVQVELRVELSGVDTPANTKSLHGAALRVSQRHRVRRQLADRLLVPGIRPEG